MKLSVIIPNYNGEKLLKNNFSLVIDSLRSSKIDFEIIISDDCSTDNSISVIEEFIKKYNDVGISLVKSENNNGFSTNVNKGVGVSTGDILLLLNTDVVPKNGFTDSALAHFKNEKVFAVGCLDESIEGSSVVKRGRGKGVWEKGQLVHCAAEIKSGDTLWVSGGSGFFRKSMWDKLGGLDEIYNPFYWEDIDISYRARKMGFKTIFEVKSVVKHEHEKGAISSKYSKKDIKKITYKNQFIFAWKNLNIGSFILSIFWLPYHLLQALVARNTELLYGFTSAFTRLPYVLKKRADYRKQFVLSDREAASTK